MRRGGYRVTSDSSTDAHSSRAAHPQSATAAGQGYFIARADESGTDPAEHALELNVRRTVGDGMREEVDLVNHMPERVHAELRLRLDADFAAPEEAQQQRKPYGEVTRKWREGG